MHGYNEFFESLGLNASKVKLTTPNKGLIAHDLNQSQCNEPKIT
jgi:hypothetical protein